MNTLQNHEIVKKRSLFYIILNLSFPAIFSVPVAETNCSATSLCTVSHGGTVYIQMMSNASGLIVRCKKGSIPVFNLKKEEVKILGNFENRTQFFINNGTLKITNLEKNDSGQYISEVFNQDGFRMRNITFQLNVQGKYKKNPHSVIMCKYKTQCITLCNVR